MCAKQSLKQPAGESIQIHTPLAPEFECLSPVPGNTIRSGYLNWRVVPRGAARSPVRNDVGRNAKPRGSSVKVSSPDKHLISVVAEQVYRSEGNIVDRSANVNGTTGVQVHGMYRRLFEELGRSLVGRPEKKRKVRFDGQGIATKSKIIPAREVRWSHSSGEVR